ncbi:MAG TPA: hypothetical protein VND20_01880 [Candidatus Binataceae bacterium]|nr:hypothetical protein [Candidatus Binataceae bacterium]
MSGYYSRNEVGLQPPTDSPGPNHDHSDNGQGYGYLSYLVNSDTRLSMVTGVAVNSFEIAPEPGLRQQFTLAGVPGYPSSPVKEIDFERNYHGIASMQDAIGHDLHYQVAAFSRYYELT